MYRQGVSVALSTWSIAPAERGRVVVGLRGAFDTADAGAFAEELRRQLASVTPGSIEVYFDLDELTRCSIDARTILLDLQRFLGHVARRTAYVANRPLFRGIGLWICHMAPDANARTFAVAVHADAWLADATPREVELAARSAHWVGRITGKEARA